MNKYEYIDKELIALDSAVESELREAEQQFMPVFARNIAVGAVSYIHLSRFFQLLLCYFSFCRCWKTADIWQELLSLWTSLSENWGCRAEVLCQ